MSSREEKVARFRALHETGCFIMPNPWDASGARMTEALGFQALATTSSGYAFSIGKVDGQVTRDVTLAHSAAMAAATDLPVNGDFEDCYAIDPEEVFETIERAAEAGLAGVSIEDRWPGGPEPYRCFEDAVERVQVAVNAAEKCNIVLTARAVNAAMQATGRQVLAGNFSALDGAPGFAAFQQDNA